MKKKNREYLGEVNPDHKSKICTSEREELESSRAYIQTEQTTLNLDELIAMMDE